jgi:hypothetical protein
MRICRCAPLSGKTPNRINPGIKIHTQSRFMADMLVVILVLYLLA